MSEEEWGGGGGGGGGGRTSEGQRWAQATLTYMIKYTK